MPIEKLSSNLYRIRELNVGFDKSGRYLSMNPGHANACVLCISRERPITIEDLTLSNQDLQMLYNGHTLDFTDKGYILQGITRHQMTAAAQYRNFKLEPPAYVQVWGMDSSQNGMSLHVPADPNEQMVLVPVYYTAVDEGNTLTVSLDHKDGYISGELLYQFDNHMPIPIPRSVLDFPIPIRRTGDQLRVIPAPGVEHKYLQKKNR